ncbi:hypothetical protein [Methylobacter svalbardensis]|uniref:hypothetical protein n=1 Tax=Methylobacter svalbardensis TaxID=3080016 RepID=UPI0030ED7613
MCQFIKIADNQYVGKNVLFLAHYGHKIDMTRWQEIAGGATFVAVNCRKDRQWRFRIYPLEIRGKMVLFNGFVSATGLIGSHNNGIEKALFM